MGWGMIRFRFGPELRPKLVPAIGLLVLCIMAGLLGFSLVQSATRQLLEAEARIDAQRWSDYLSANIPDLPAIVAGAAPAPQSLDLLKRGLAGGHLLSIRIYDAKGILTLQPDAAANAPPAANSIALLDSALARALQSHTTETLLRLGNGSTEPAHVASSLMPIILEQDIIGWLLVNIDQTERHELYSAIVNKASIAVCLLIISMIRLSSSCNLSLVRWNSLSTYRISSSRTCLSSMLARSVSRSDGSVRM